MIRALRLLRDADVDVVTFGQYMRPTKRHLPVVEYLTPEAFDAYREIAEGMGFLYVASGPMVRLVQSRGVFPGGGAQTEKRGRHVPRRSERA